ncbi:MAG: glycine-rich domain-containing protein-like [Telluria sp.]
MQPTHDFQAIADLDLDPIKVKLMHDESGEGWSLEKATAVEAEYRRFLYLMKKFPEEQTAPLMDVDTFWHYHILDTMKYAVDCDKVFGYFLHHFPYIGLRGEEDVEAHHRVGERMKELYEATFGEPYLKGAAAYSGATAQAAYSGATAQTAYSGATAQTAYSGATAKTAYSGATAKTAYSGATAKTAYSGATAKTAYSGAAAKTAYSGATAKVAYSGANVQTAYSGANVQTAYSGANVAASDFYASRPKLPRAA